VIFLLNLEVGYLHPPVGLNLFITSFTFRKPILEVTLATLPFLLLMVMVLLVITYVPALTIVPPPERRGLVSTMIRDVRLAREQATVVQEIELAPGKILKLNDCNKLTEQLDRDTCAGLFVEVTKCRSAAGGQLGSECEKNAIAEYVELTAEESEDWNTPDEGEEPQEPQESKKQP
jgi:hypothetical protein